MASKIDEIVEDLRAQGVEDPEDRIDHQIDTMYQYLQTLSPQSTPGGVAASSAQIILNFINSADYMRFETRIFRGRYLAFPKSTVTSYFGWRTLYGKPNLHRAIDMAVARGTPIPAVDDGIVVYVRRDVTREGDPNGGYGNFIILYHGKYNGNDIFSVYGHCQSVIVSNGQTVFGGETIGYVGSTGNSTGPHLHFEINLYDGSQVLAVDPQSILSFP